MCVLMYKSRLQTETMERDSKKGELGKCERKGTWKRDLAVEVCSC